jgi:hypothetical protein
MAIGGALLETLESIQEISNVMKRRDDEADAQNEAD